MTDARIIGGQSELTRASLRDRPHPWAERAIRILIGVSAVVAGAGFALILVGASMVIDLFE